MTVAVVDVFPKRHVLDPIAWNPYPCTVTGVPPVLTPPPGLNCSPTAGG